MHFLLLIVHNNNRKNKEEINWFACVKLRRSAVIFLLPPVRPWTAGAATNPGDRESGQTTSLLLGRCPRILRICLLFCCCTIIFVIICSCCYFFFLTWAISKEVECKERRRESERRQRRAAGTWPASLDPRSRAACADMMDVT